MMRLMMSVVFHLEHAALILSSIANTSWTQATEDLISQGTSSTQISLGKRSRISMDSEEHTISGHGEAHVTASVGSNENLDHLDEDLLRSHESRAAGYMGLNSEVQWLSSVQRQTEHTGREPLKQSYGPPGKGPVAATARSDAFRERRSKAKDSSKQGSMPHITESTFYLDHESLNVDTTVDLYADPQHDVAERLFNCYYQTVHPSFPLVSQFVHSISCNASANPHPCIKGTRGFQWRVPQIPEIA
jgi:hypothetical protein